MRQILQLQYIMPMTVNPHFAADAIIILHIQSVFAQILIQYRLFGHIFQVLAGMRFQQRYIWDGHVLFLREQRFLIRFGTYAQLLYQADADFNFF